MLDWMFWTTSTAIFLSLLILFFLSLIVLDLRRRSELPTKGFLPMATTRGDRIFLGIALVIVIGILWLKFVPLPMRYSMIPAIAAFALTVLKG